MMTDATDLERAVAEIIDPSAFSLPLRDAHAGPRILALDDARKILTVIREALREPSTEMCLDAGAAAPQAIPAEEHLWFGVVRDIWQAALAASPLGAPE